MWIVFRDPLTIFNHLDKYVFELIEDDDILAFQETLQATVGGRKREIHQDVYFLQPFFTSKDDVEYFARRYNRWQSTSQASM